MYKALRHYVLQIPAICVVFFALSGCGGGYHEDKTGASDINRFSYASLAENNYMSHAAAQPPEDIFADVRHFELMRVDAPTMSFSAPNDKPYVVYQPAYASLAVKAQPVSMNAMPGAGIAGFKPIRDIPAECQGMMGEALQACIENANPQGLAAQDASPHTSHFDANALRALLGSTFEEKLIGKIIDSNLAHIDSRTRAQMIAKLSDYINDSPAHQSLDLSKFDLFDRSGFSLSEVTFTDGSRGDVNRDGRLEQHTTVILKISKKLPYRRSAHHRIDTARQKLSGLVPEESYLFNLRVFIHLNNLGELRARSPSGTQLTADDAMARLDEIWKARWINKSMDANILKKIVESPDLIPWKSSEYAMSFQVSPKDITQSLVPAMVAAMESGDTETYHAIDQHINAQTAIVTGSGILQRNAPNLGNAGAGVNVFFQVSQPRPKAASGDISSFEYGMFDASGNRVAIRDPATGNLILGGEAGVVAANAASAVQPMKWTKAGACLDDKSDWAYWPSRARTGQFGRGINWIATEMLLHNQVADYKNIHWYQSLEKSAIQVAVKGGMWVLANYLKVQWGAAGKMPDNSDYVLLYIYEVALPTIHELLSDSSGTHGKTVDIAGYSYQIDAKVIRFFLEAKLYAKNATFMQKTKAVVGGVVLGFIIDRVSDGVGQSLDTTLTGWQDYSDGSHKGCFKFD
ncbi:MAG: hypothetical protein H6R04_1462 [Burkholderiaceae bacterium]|nr:hypothetical protein [Burkholderiaceae bacterium]